MCYCFCCYKKSVVCDQGIVICIADVASKCHAVGYLSFFFWHQIVTEEKDWLKNGQILGSFNIRDMSLYPPIAAYIICNYCKAQLSL